MSWIEVGLDGTLGCCGVARERTTLGWRFLSSRERFGAFEVSSPVERWETTGSGLLAVRDRSAAFPDTALRLVFGSGSVLAVYASGHIRWVPWAAFSYYCELSEGRLPELTQGDLLAFRLADDTVPSFCARLWESTPDGAGTLWAEAPCAGTRETAWKEAFRLEVGGNHRHRAIGHFRCRPLVMNDPRTIQIHTLAATVLDHDPIDDIHPRRHLPPGADYLLTKLPGFSDPAVEATPGVQV